VSIWLDTLSRDLLADDAERMLAAAAAGGVDLAAVTAGLEREGVSPFCDSYHRLLACIEHKLTAVGARP